MTLSRIAGWAAVAATATVLTGFMVSSAGSFPIYTNQSVLPAGTELNEDTPVMPRELFKSDAIGGHRSYLVNLGDMAFSSPSILGDVARQAGISCDTCHLNGVSNPKFFMPGLSTHPGNFDTTSALFKPQADNGVLDPVTIPSLRGARYLAPYGHDGRMASLRDFVHNVIVNEFDGPEPSPQILDALVTYIQDIDFLPNPRIGENGRLAANASDAEKRGEALFSKPFPHDPALSCVTCHQPSAAFVDHQQHDVGAGGLYKTPTLLNADFNAPYFHDGRYDSYDQVVAHFDRFYGLGLSAQDRSDLVAYLTAVGDGEQAMQPVSIDAQVQEIQHFDSVLDTAIPAHNLEVIDLAVDTVGGELRECTEDFPDRKDTSVDGGWPERAKARAALKGLVLDLRRIDAAAALGRFDEARDALATYRKELAEAVPLMKAAEPWSLFNPPVRTAHYMAMRQLFKSATRSVN